MTAAPKPCSAVICAEVMVPFWSYANVDSGTRKERPRTLCPLTIPAVAQFTQAPTPAALVSVEEPLTTAGVVALQPARRVPSAGSITSPDPGTWMDVETGNADLALKNAVRSPATSGAVNDESLRKCKTVLARPTTLTPDHETTTLLICPAMCHHSLIDYSMMHQRSRAEA